MKQIKKLLNLNIAELEKRLKKVYGVENQWAIVLTMYMEDYESKFPGNKMFKAKKGRELFMARICETLVFKKVIGKDMKTGKYIFPVLILGQSKFHKEVAEHVHSAIIDATKRSSKTDTKI